MRFQSEGQFAVTVTEARIAKPKFCEAPGAFDVALKVSDGQQEDWWRGEVSGEYGKGHFSDRTQAQLTLEQLQRLGYQYGTDFSKVETLVGVQTVANVKEKKGSDGNTYHNVTHLGEGGNEPETLDPQTAQQLAANAAQFFPGDQAPAQPPVPAQQPQQAAAQAPQPNPAQQPQQPQQPQQAPATGGGKNPFA